MTNKMGKQLHGTVVLPEILKVSSKIYSAFHSHSQCLKDEGLGKALVTLAEKVTKHGERVDEHRCMSKMALVTFSSIVAKNLELL